jgi:hypothetical protein
VPIKFVVFGLMRNGNYRPIGNAGNLDEAKREAAEYMAANPSEATADFRVILEPAALDTFLDPDATARKLN